MTKVIIKNRHWFDSPENIPKGRNKGHTILMLYMSLSNILKTLEKTAIVCDFETKEYISYMAEHMLLFLPRQRKLKRATLKQLTDKNYLKIITHGSEEIKILLRKDKVHKVYADNSLSQTELCELESVCQNYGKKIFNRKEISRSFIQESYIQEIH